MVDNTTSYDDGSHFISSLLLVDENIRAKKKDETNIRWIVIGLHDALYALLVESIVRTDGFGIFDAKFEKKVKEFYESGLSSKSPEFVELCESSFSAKVASLGELLKRALPSSDIRIINEVTDETPSPTKGLNFLKEMRNYFAHPRPMTSVYFDNYLQLAVSDTIHVIRSVRELAPQRRLQHDPEEAQVLLASIEYYRKRWEIEEP